MKNSKQIIENVLEYLGVKAPTFAKQVGITYQSIYNIINGDTKNISTRMANQICSAYPDINRVYLLTGEGSISKKLDIAIESPKSPIEEDIITDTEEVSDGFPVIPVALVDRPNTNIWEEVKRDIDQFDRLNIQHLVSECDLAYRVISDVMSPDITIGDILFLKKISRSQILNGECYFVDTMYYGVLVRYLFQEDGNIKCMAPNRPQQELIIPLNEIYGIYAIRGKFSCRITYSESTSLVNQVANGHISQLINEVAKAGERADRAGERVDKLISLLEKQLTKE